MDEAKLEQALAGVANIPAAAPKIDIPAPAQATDAEPAPEIGDPADDGQQAQGEPAPDPQTGPAIEFEFEHEGKTHKLIGRETIQAELAKARDYSQKTEQIARMREALVAKMQLQQAQSEFQGQIMGDIADLRMLDSRLEQFARVDWNAAIDSNFTEAMKLQEQRNQLKQLRDARLGELNYKQQQFQQGQATAAQQLLAAEWQVLVAKLPELRNSEKASAEVKQINASLANAGFNQAEIGALTDHRMVLVARKAMLYDQLMANKDSRVKQAREAPPMVQPGAAPPTPDGRAQFAKARAKIREFGSKGNHGAQERLVTQMFERAFKLDKPA